MTHFTAEILSNIEVAPGYWRMAFDTAGAIDYRSGRPEAGQFVHIRPASERSYDPLLRRAFSVLRASERTLEILFRVGGKGTIALSRLKGGDYLDVLSPLGQPFDVSGKSASDRMILVGGGVGIPPLAMLAYQETNGLSDDPLYSGSQNMAVIIGGRTANDILCEADFLACGITPHIATNDGSRGRLGLVTDILSELLATTESPDPAQEISAKTDVFHVKQYVYACGPLPMLRAVASLCDAHGTPCQVSLEENMPCGIGVCNGCVVPVVPGAGPGDEFARYRRICVEGPVLRSSEIDWASLCSPTS
jgi:dihydroorotate dehydrogenase electron transfer subunit